MRLVIFGATGATGRHVIEQALKLGHNVTAIVRAPGAFAMSHPKLKTTQAELHDPAAMRLAVQNQDVIISVLGVRKGGSSTICADGAKSILAAMAATGTRRLVALSAYGASETQRDTLFIRFVRSVIAAKMRDKDEMERLIRNSDVTWTLVRPPALTNGKLTGSYRFGSNLKIGMSGRISRSDLAEFILKEAISDANSKKILSVTY